MKNNTTLTGSQSQNAHILVVGDDLIAQTLKSSSYAVVVAGDGQGALEIVRSRPVDLFLWALHPPETAGLAQLVSDESLRDIPVMAACTTDDAREQAIRLGVDDVLPWPVAAPMLKLRVQACLERKALRDREQVYRSEIRRERKRVNDLLNVVIPIGLALAAERDFNSLLEKILLETKSFCNADAGTLYLRTDDDLLKFVIVRNDSLGIAMGGTSGQEVSFPLLPMVDPTTGEPNYHNVATHVALTGSSINIPDAYTAEGYDFSGTKTFDKQTGYRSKSFWTLPLKSSQKEVIGVLQLINALAPGTGEVIPFNNAGIQPMVESMAALAAVALEAYIREQGLRQEILQLRIELDRAKREQQVAEITDSEYFRRLQAKAHHLRRTFGQDE